MIKGYKLHRDDYIPILARLLPGAVGLEVELRCSIMHLGDCARSRLQYCRAESGGVLRHVAALSSEYRFEPLSLDDLRSLVFHLRRLTSSASGLEAFGNRVSVQACGQSNEHAE